MTTVKEGRQFGEFISSELNFDDILALAIGWIHKNIEPEDVFDESDLSDWAENNGYTKESSIAFQK